MGARNIKWKVGGKESNGAATPSEKRENPGRDSESVESKNSTIKEVESTREPSHGEAMRGKLDHTQKDTTKKDKSNDYTNKRMEYNKRK